jgi:acetyl/propionyl-CoA carboxylase alpha subunit/acetyl-CoA carboxylase carboxyltransferase component
LGTIKANNQQPTVSSSLFGFNLGTASGSEFNGSSSSGAQSQGSATKHALTGVELLGAFYAQPSPSLSRLKQKIIGTNTTLKEAFASLSTSDQAELKGRVGKSRLSEIFAFTSSNSPEAFWNGAFNLGSGLARSGNHEKAAAGGAVLQVILNGGEGVSPEVMNRAGRELEVLNGGGSTAEQALRTARGIVPEMLKAEMIVPMIFAGPVGQAGTTFLRGRALAGTARGVSLGMKARAGTALGGFGLETAFFSGASMGMQDALHGGVDWSAGEIGKSVLGAGLTLGVLKGVNHSAQGMFANVMKSRGVQGPLTGAWRAAQVGVGQSSAYLGLVTAHSLEVAVGMRPEDGSNVWLSSLGTHVSMMGGMCLGLGILNSIPVYRAWHQGITARWHEQTQARGSGTSQGGLFERAVHWGQRVLQSEAEIWNNGGLPPGAAPEALGGGYSTSPASRVFDAAVEASSPHSVNMTARDASRPSASGGPGGPTGSGDAQPLRGRYVLIGNRGEPAMRCVREALALGATPVLFASEVDLASAAATHSGVMVIPLKGNEPNETYNNIPARMEALERFLEAHDIHVDRLVAWEGWGFQSESPEMFRAYEDRGIPTAGAPSQLHKAMGDKVEARRIATKAGAALSPGSLGAVTAEEAEAFFRQHSPVIIKGVATGGGKAVEKAFAFQDVRAAHAKASREAQSTANDSRVYIEELVPDMRHLEIQVMADGRGNFVIVGERECSLQRKNQKIIEETGSHLPPEIITQMREIASRIMSHPELKSYRGPGTIEMKWDIRNDQILFMEMNTRLQVEHTVTEMVTGRNLLQEQLRLGAGLPRTFESVETHGHAIELRITSEDPYNDFKSSNGRIVHMQLPSGEAVGRTRVRVDSGVTVNSEISGYYDSMIAKLIVWGETRAEALAAAERALEEFEIVGVKTNIPFLRALVRAPEFREGRVPHTGFVEKSFLLTEAGRPVYRHTEEAVLTAAVETYLSRKDQLRGSPRASREAGVDPRVDLEFNGQGYGVDIYESGPGSFMARLGDSLVEVGLVRTGDYTYTLQIDGRNSRCLIHRDRPGNRNVLIDGVNYDVKVAGEIASGPGHVASPSPASVTEVLVQPGDRVHRGQDLVKVTAMKNETAIQADVGGVVTEVKVKEGDKATPGVTLIVIKPEGGAEVDASAPIAQASGFSLPPALLARIAEGTRGADLPTAERRAEIMVVAERLFEGYEIPADLLQQALAVLTPRPIQDSDAGRMVRGLVGVVREAREAEDRRAATVRGLVDLVSGRRGETPYSEELQAWLGGLLHRYQVIERLFQPSYHRELDYFINTGQVVEGSSFSRDLQIALGLFGINNLRADPARDEAVFRLCQSHARLRQKSELLMEVFPAIQRLRLTGLEGQLRAVLQTSENGNGVSVHPSFRSALEHTLNVLGGALDASRQEGLSAEFRRIERHVRNPDDRKEAISTLLQNHSNIIPFLLSQAGQGRQARRQLAMELIQRCLYDDYFQVEAQRADRGIVQARLSSNGHGEREQAQAVLIRVDQLRPGDLANRLNAGFRNISNNPTYVDIVLPPEVSEAQIREIESAVTQALGRCRVEPQIAHLTLVIPGANNGRTAMRTYSYDHANGLRENQWSRNIHPLRAQALGLDRWTENFDLESVDLGLYPNVRALRAWQRGVDWSDPAQARAGDRQNIVVGVHGGEFHPQRFNVARVEERLVGDYRAIKKDSNVALNDESILIWSWLPSALAERGRLGAHELFDTALLTAHPRQLIERFKLGETALRDLAQCYRNKVYSIPEVEQLVANMRTTISRLQEVSDEDPRLGIPEASGIEAEHGNKLPTVADIYIDRPIEGFSDTDLRLLAFRLAPRFVDLGLEKTTIHFNRNEGGRISSHIAEVRSPAQARFQVDIKPAQEDVPPHRVKTPLEHKRASQQAKGKLYVYDRVHDLTRETLAELYPGGKVPSGALKIQELVLDDSGELVPTERPIGQNNIGRVAFLVEANFPTNAAATQTVKREFAVIADDMTHQGGSQGVKEGAIYAALSRLAEERGIPKVYLVESSGARLGFAKEVYPYVGSEHHISQTGKLVIDSIYLREADLDTPVGKSKRPLRDLVLLGAPYEATVEQGGTAATETRYPIETIQQRQLLSSSILQEPLLPSSIMTETRYPIETIIGEGPIGTESLGASGVAGESESRAREHVPTFAIAFGTAVGIATYKAKLAERVIMVDGSYLGLTGHKAINETFALGYRTETEIAGPEIMDANGVAYKIAHTELDAMRAFMRWLSYLPVKQGERAPLYSIGDPVDRNVGAALAAAIPGDRQPYDTRQVDNILYDGDSVFYVRNGQYGRAVNTGYARLGGAPVGIITMQLAPTNPLGADPVFGGALDPASAFKVARHIRNLDREGLPLIFNASISGFMPRRQDQIEGVVPAGARILDALRVFSQPALIYTPPGGQLWGGAWVVMDRGVNPNIAMAADHTAAMGILGSQGAISVPLIDREVRQLAMRDPRIARLNEQIRQQSSDVARQEIRRERDGVLDKLITEYYGPLTRLFIDRTNTARRAHRVGSIHHLITDTGQTRAELYRILTDKRVEVEQRNAATAQRVNLAGALNLAGVSHRFTRDGRVEITSGSSSVTLSVEEAAARISGSAKGLFGD